MISPDFVCTFQYCRHSRTYDAVQSELNAVLSQPPTSEGSKLLVRNVLDKAGELFDDSFDNNCYLNQCEQLFDSRGTLWIITSLYQFYFERLYSNSFLVRQRHVVNSELRRALRRILLMLSATVLPIMTLTPSSLLILTVLYMFKPQQSMETPSESTPKYFISQNLPQANSTINN